MKKGKLGRPESVYTGELTAIFKALEFIKLDKQYDTYRVYSDSKSSLQNIAKGEESMDSYTRRITSLLKSLEEDGINIHLHWIPGHRDIEGNEYADHEAKAAALDDRLDEEVGIHLSTIKANAKKETEKRWQLEWDLASTGRHAHKIIPDIHRQLYFFNPNSRSGIPRHLQVSLFRLVVGHFPCKDYLFRFNRTDDPCCSFGCQRRETVSHILLECPAFACERFKASFVSEVDLDLEGMLTNPRLLSLVTFIAKTTLRRNRQQQQ